MMKRKWNGSDIIDRYVYDVIRRLPINQQREIESELRASIEDMLDAIDAEGKRERAQVEQVLYELGKPSNLATTYRGEPRYLIGPAYFDDYIMLLRIVVPIVVIVMLGIGAFSVMLTDNILQTSMQVLGSALDGGIQAAAWVTGIMAIVSFVGGKQNKIESWNIDDLLEVPDHSIVIKRSDSIASLVFLVIGLILWMLFADKIGIYLMQDKLEITPLFEMQVLVKVQFLMILVLLFDMMQELLRLIEGRWTLRLVAVDVILNTISTILALWFVNTKGLFHQPFYELVQKSVASIGWTLHFSLPVIASFFIVVVYLGEMLALAYKTWKHHPYFKKS